MNNREYNEALRQISRRIMDRRAKMEEKIRIYSTERPMAWSDHDFIEWKAKADAFLTSSLVVLEALKKEPSLPRIPPRRGRKQPSA